MKIAYKLIFIFLIIPILSFSTNIKGKHKKTKEISKTFDANNETILNIKNKFGNVDITTWNQNSIEIDVEITISGNDEDKITDKLDKINIEFNQENNQVFASTHISKSKSKSWFSSSWFNWSLNSSINIQINYTIKMPIENDLNIFNDYGSIVLNELNGKANINCDYGKIIIGNLNNLENKINVDYTNHSSIEFIESATINADYSNFTVEKANAIILNADYSTSKFNEIYSIKYNCDFGSVKIGEATNILGKGDYSTVTIDLLNTAIDINADFGSLKINSLNENFESAKINADYTSIKIGIDSQASCNILAKLSYGNFKYNGDLFTFNKKKEGNTSKEYEGFFNSANNNSTIITNTEFGNVHLYQSDAVFNGQRLKRRREAKKAIIQRKKEINEKRAQKIRRIKNQIKGINNQN